MLFRSDDIHFHIGILFNEKRTPAHWEEDPQQGTSRRLIEQFERELPSDLTKDLRDITLDADDLKLEFDVPVAADSDDTISFHLSFLYGDVYLNTIYSGSLDAVGRDGSLDAFDTPRSLRDIISDNEADDLWLGFSIAERENKVFEMSEEERNNAMAIADMILESDMNRNRLVEFRSMLLSGERNRADNELLSFARDLAEEYNEQRDDKYVEGVYGGDPLDYLRDVAVEVLVYDAISRPIFLRQFPRVEEAEGKTEEELARVRRTFENYLFDIESDTEKKRRIYRCVRNQTVYSGSGENVPESEEDGVEWTSAPTSSDIGDLLDIRAPTKILNSMTDRTKNTDGGILVNEESRYAVPASVAQLMEPYMRELPEDVKTEA